MLCTHLHMCPLFVSALSTKQAEAKVAQVLGNAVRGEKNGWMFIRENIFVSALWGHRRHYESVKTAHAEKYLQSTCAVNRDSWWCLRTVASREHTYDLSVIFSFFFFFCIYLFLNRMFVWEYDSHPQLLTHKARGCWVSGCTHWLQEVCRSGQRGKGFFSWIGSKPVEHAHSVKLCVCVIQLAHVHTETKPAT